ncbi:MAG: triose-phosphate isomerase [Candidatus Woesearchaeota archaeon]
MEDALIINFKTYKESTANGAIKITKAAERALKQAKGNIILVPQTVDLREVAKTTKLKVFAQHTDLEERGGHTGSTNIDALKLAGAKGVLINHSEKRLPLRVIEKTIKLCKDKKMISVVCTKTIKETETIAKLKPDYIAIEPPSLIGGTISISKAKPELIKKAVQASKKIRLLCGAGVHEEEDVRVAKNLGSNGILVASGVIKAKNIEKEIISLLKGFKTKN